MDPASYRLRPFDARDYADAAQVQSAVNPERKFTADEVRHFDEKVLTPPLTNLKVVCEDRSTSRAIGFGYLFTDIESRDPLSLWAEVVVAPSHQARGIGLALAEALDREARRLGVRQLYAGARTTDLRAVHFLNLQGFTVRARTWRSRLEVSSAVIPRDRTDELRRQGFTFATLEQENVEDPRLLRELYELTVATSADEPRLGPYTPVTLEQFIERDLRGPGFLPGAFFLAKRAGRLVGSSALRRIELVAGALHQSFTGTRREIRGLGVATELKRRGVEYARAHGYREIQTGNDSRNLPMLEINRRMGYQPETMRILASRSLVD